jgi:hypothetical protein
MPTRYKSELMRKKKNLKDKMRILRRVKVVSEKGLM